jgi:hypothetical protein
VNDIDNQPRPGGAWDRGADELAATPLFRSVGITATALVSGAANALTIVGSTATFGALPNNIGVGDDSVRFRRQRLDQRRLHPAADRRQNSW